tara:strand:- start:426 stop:737 length:312 start_codon:yes stop_codon:yes gene_type:complete
MLQCVAAVIITIVQAVIIITTEKYLFVDTSSKVVRFIQFVASNSVWTYLELFVIGGNVYIVSKIIKKETPMWLKTTTGVIIAIIILTEVFYSADLLLSKGLID